MPKIFISYRRADSLTHAGRLDDRLWVHFGRDNVFKDFDSINKAMPFAKVIQDALQVSDLIVVVIGRQWANLRDEQNNIRLQVEDDLVRYEVRTGLERWREGKAFVLPVLIDGANMPKKSELPSDLHELAGLNAHTLQNDPYFHRDVDDLLKAIGKLGLYPQTHVQVVPFNAFQAIAQYYQYRSQNKFDDAREVLAKIRDANLKLAGFDLDVQEKDLWTAIQAKERDDNYALIRLIPEVMPHLIQAQLETFWQTYPNYDPDNLARFKPQAPKLQPFGLQLPKWVAREFRAKQPFDDLIPPPFDWCEIPAGKVRLEAGGYVPDGGKIFHVAAFHMAKYPITNAQYQLFIEAGGYENKAWWKKSGWKWKGNQLAPKDNLASDFLLPDHPRVNVSWYEAMAFCVWLSETTSKKILLPTEQQWQRAAQGDDGLVYPWGNDWDGTKSYSWRSGGLKTKTASVTMYMEGASPFGVVDMVGNVWEWCLTEYETGRQGVNGTNRVTVRGGSWDYTDSAEMYSSIRGVKYPDHSKSSLGFRIARLLD